MCAAARTLNEYWCSGPENTGESRVGTTEKSELHSQPDAPLSNAGAQITRERAQNVQEYVCAPVRACARTTSRELGEEKVPDGRGT